jgi:hypothetical protein
VNESSDSDDEYREAESDDTEPIQRVRGTVDSNALIECGGERARIAWIFSLKSMLLFTTFPLSTQIRMKSLESRAADKNEFKHERRKTECGRKITYRKSMTPRCIESEYFPNRALEDMTVQNNPSVLMAFSSSNGTMISKGMNDSCHANKPRNIDCSSDRTMMIDAMGSILSQFDESIVEPLSLFKKSLSRGCIRSVYGPGVSRFGAIKYWAGRFEEGNRDRRLRPTECDNSIWLCSAIDPYGSYPHFVVF